MNIRQIDQKNRKEIDDFIIRQWFTLQMVVHGESIDLGTVDGWYAVQDDAIVGLITYRVTDGTMEILSLDSLNEHHGTGTALLNMAVSYAKTNGISKLSLITTNDNLSALRFYQKRGFDMVRLYRNAVERSRRLKPEIPLLGTDGIPLKHEIELEMDLGKDADDPMGMSHIEKYQKYFTKEYLMGPNSFRLLDELIRRRPEGVCFDRTLDLGCGYALTSLFIANETNAEHVYAFDLWIPATENYLRIREQGLEDKIIPIHGDAMDMPFPQEYFDTIVSVDAYHYFGCKEGIFTEKILPYVKRGGSVMIVVPGLKERPQGELKRLFETWAEGDDSELFKTAAWWEKLLKDECKDQCSIEVKEADCYDIAWQEWFQSGHEYGVRDKEYLDQGLYDILDFLLIYVRKRWSE